MTTPTPTPAEQFRADMLRALADMRDELESMRAELAQIRTGLATASQPAPAQSAPTAPVAARATVQAAADSKSEAKILVQRKPGRDSYAIQESSFQSRKKAERRAQHLEKKGLPVKVVATKLGGSKWYRVLVGPYASVDAAKKTQEKMLLKGGVSEE